MIKREDDPEHLAESFIAFVKSAFRAIRLINIPRGKADLTIKQQDWLTQASTSIPRGRNYVPSIKKCWP